MKIQIASDIHTEFVEYSQLDALENFLRLAVPVAPGIDALVVAGDLGNSDSVPFALDALRRNAPDVEILYVAGNHEYYAPGNDKSRAAIERAIAASCQKNHIHWLNNSSVELHNRRFLGTTLWGFRAYPQCR